MLSRWLAQHDTCPGEEADAKQPAFPLACCQNLLSARNHIELVASTAPVVQWCQKPSMAHPADSKTMIAFFASIYSCSFPQRGSAPPLCNDSPQPGLVSRSDTSSAGIQSRGAQLRHTIADGANVKAPCHKCVQHRCVYMQCLHSSLPTTAQPSRSFLHNLPQAQPPYRGVMDPCVHSWLYSSQPNWISPQCPN